ncbi:uncharacterized protein LOC108209063 isoform X2 [Daucus carota subsp. sativus]|uniref:uncharacterized protein LOC108209063 isoform X2 n=1 Tax=Daucus carota subsp. sativus TaxID=79200 RepID=UPI0007EFBE0A|nr:PREDICTED: uncharacterized protein LOC108209063 isoform X2 [Daucus carota subsp. sativus]
MSSGQSPDWLPAGWNIRSKSNDYGKKIKFYVDPATGRKFYSKAQVEQYLEKTKTETVSESVPEVAIVPAVAICTPTNAVKNTNESTDWLPDGWIVEERARNSGATAGSKFKVYTDPKSGHKFYSKPEVLRYLAKTGGSTTPLLDINVVNKVSSTVVQTKQTNEEMKQTNEEIKQRKEEKKETNESPEWLPQGWSVESKTGDCGKRRKVYTDPTSGLKFYSKPQVSRYLEKINGNSSLQIVISSNSSPRIVTGSANDLCIDQSTESGPLLKPDVSPNHQGTFERVIDEKFPAGWVKEIRMRKTSDKHKDQFYIDPVSGYMFRSKVDALRFVETGDIKMCKCRPMKRDISDLNLISKSTPNDLDQSRGGRNFSKSDFSEEHKTNQSNISEDPSVVKGSMSNDTFRKNSSEEIPPGWKIEYKTRKMANRIVKDPYYLDPVSGYEFRSKPDVLRYLDTGDINSCKIKPKKRDVNDLKTEENTFPSSAEAKKSGTTTKRQSPGEIMDNTIVSKSVVSPEAGRSRSRRKSVSVPKMDLSSPMMQSSQKISEPMNKESKGEETEIVNLSTANDIILSVINDIFNDDEVLESERIMQETESAIKSRKETESAIKSKKKRVLNPPLRSSKRLAGVNLNNTGKSSLGESSQALAGGDDETKADPLSHINASPREVPQQLKTPTEGEVADPTFISNENILSYGLNGSGEKPVDQSVTENQIGKQVTEKLGNSLQKELAQNAGQQGDASENHLERQEMEKQNDGRNLSEQPPIEYPYMEDPCFEFAFKTLTGAIPVEENLSFQDYFKQEADTSQNEHNGHVGQPIFSSVEVASQSAAIETPVPLQQFPSYSTYPASTSLPPGFANTSVPPGFANTSMPPGFANTSVPPGFANTSVPPGFANTSVPPGFANTSQQSGFVPPGFANTSQHSGFGTGWQTTAK